MIELAAAAWKIDPQAAARRLDGLPGRTPHAPQEFESYLEQQARAAKLAAFWDKCRDRLRKSTKLPKAIQLLTRKSFGDTNPQLDRIDQPLGLVSREQLKEFGAELKLTFPGDCDWYLLQAAYDLPERIRGFWLYSHRMASCRGIFVATTPDYAEICYTMRPSVYTATKQVPNDLMLMLNPWLALMLQTRHQKNNVAPLPLLGMSLPKHSIRHTHAHLGNRRRVLITNGPASELAIPVLVKVILTARELNASIGHILEHGQAITRFYDRRPVDWLQRICQEAKSWRTVLEEALGRLGVDEVTSLLRSLALQPDEVRPLLRACSESVRTALAKSAETATARFRDILLVQAEHGWVKHTGEQVSNAKIRVEEIITTVDASTYRGRLIFREQVIPFDWTGPTGASSRFARYLFTLAASHNLTFSLHRSLTNAIFDVAKQFHTPIIRKGISQVGWISPEAGFRFPKFVIGSLGKVTADADSVYVGTSDVGDLPPPSFISGPELRALDDPALPLALAILAGTMQSALAPAMQGERPQLAFTSLGVHETSSVLAKTIRCRMLHITAADHRIYDRNYSTAQLQDWPTFLHPSNCTGPRLRHLTQCGGRNLFVCAEPPQGTAMATTGWTIIDDSAAVPVGDFLRAFRALPTNYFQDVASRRFDMQREATPFMTILTDLLVWLKKIGGPALNVTDIPIRSQGCPPETLCRLVAENPRRKLGVTRDGEKIHVNKHTLWSAIRKEWGINIDAAALTASLRQAGALLEQTNDAVWVLPATWWDSRQL